MTKRVVRAATPQEIAKAEEKQADVAAKPAARFVSKKERSRTVVLEYPVEYDGTVYEELKPGRLSGAEVSEFAEILRGIPDGESYQVQMVAFFCRVPEDVIAALDSDDFLEVSDAASDFLPRKLQMAIEQTSETGANTPAS
ncbi:conserved hypothetical protein [Roseibium sp. TrichSKD4]|uniref:phage tail assembly protein n=1 Tax=Roseibium sp. TrichSKD4 TaxID=744980 RepID=UPI0001E56D5A|nr:phage tail assembly protein [Roseibium sp. TrichSKD4]EFO32139.1 conserved hypothetical protein [Roseibium sp. TrichSKD4]